MEQQNDNIKITPTAKQKFIILKGQFFFQKNASETLEALVRNWYKHNQLTSKK